MKTRSIVIFFLLPLLMACTSSKKYLEHGQYDSAIRKAAAKLRKKPDNTKQIAVLKEAYRLANQRDLERISYLKASGQPEIWEEIFEKYAALKSRQDLVKTLPVNVLSTIGYDFVSYDNDVLEAEKKACEYFYAHAVSLLAKNDKTSARQAYENLQKIKSHYSSFRDVDDLLVQARERGMTHVLFSMKNNSGAILPQGFEDELLKISLDDAGTFWVSFDTRSVSNRNYDYNIDLTLKNIDVSPERIRETQWEESRQVEDGWQYVYDANGNVLKDSLGNDIKTPRYKTIYARIRETQMNKNAMVSGTVDLYSNKYSQLMRSERITAESVFNYGFLMVAGDLDALSRETRSRLGNGPAPFPNDLDMIMMAADYLKNSAKNIVRSFRQDIY